MATPAGRGRTPLSGLVGRPTARPSLGYRLFRALFRVAARLFQVEIEGLENLPRDGRGRPRGGWICAGLPHRTWLEPLLLVALLPARPRLTMMADAPTAVGSWWRRLLVGWVGGVVLIPRRARGGLLGFAGHVEGIRQALDAETVFSIFPEVGRLTRPPELRQVSVGVAYFALRTGAPIVPIVFGGTHDLFLRRPIRVRVLPAIHPPTPAPTPESPQERAAAGQLLGELLEHVRPVAAELHAAAEPPPGTSKRMRWLQAGFPRVD
jgi:1-acyl-sn-glycerol-3-phosphate acyltransferase